MNIQRRAADVAFHGALLVPAAFYVLLILALLVADAAYTTPGHLARALSTPQIQYAVFLSLATCTVTAILSLVVAVPVGYLMSRYDFRGKQAVDAVLDIPIVLPPLVIGVSLLILFATPIGNAIEQVVRFRFAVPGIVLAQWTVAAAFAVRTMRVTFDQISPRTEQVALTLGCTRFQAFRRVVLPQARRGMVAAATVAWARALGEFGPVLVFCGSKGSTLVLPTAVYLDITIGDLEGAVAVSLLMVLVALLVLVTVRALGVDPFGTRQRP